MSPPMDLSAVYRELRQLNENIEELATAAAAAMPRAEVVRTVESAAEATSEETKRQVRLGAVFTLVIVVVLGAGIVYGQVYNRTAVAGEIRDHRFRNEAENACTVEALRRVYPPGVTLNDAMNDYFDCVARRSGGVRAPAPGGASSVSKEKGP